MMQQELSHQTLNINPSGSLLRCLSLHVCLVNLNLYDRCVPSPYGAACPVMCTTLSLYLSLRVCVCVGVLMTSIDPRQNKAHQE